MIVLDEQMQPVITNDGNNSSFVQVGGNNTANMVAQTISQRPIARNGYVYIYVSNELRSTS